ncbi:MAG: DUF2155 domain-containing protein [Pseudomonadota bacterium]|nr:DUF2155 domain-containing protein [Pseudomonadota bacterium]
MRIFFAVYFSLVLFSINVISQEIECQGAVLRILNKTTNEKIYYTVPLSQTIELENHKIVVHRCVKVENEGKNDEIALMSHKLKRNNLFEENFFGWIFKSSQHINSPKNPIFDIKLETCLFKDPIFPKYN